VGLVAFYIQSCRIGRAPGLDAGRQARTCHNVSYNVDDVVKGVKRVTSVLVYSIVVAVENKSRDIEMMSFDSCD
jgi:hypothetical protein